MVARTVSHGIDNSGLTAKIPARGNMGSLWFDEQLGRLLAYDDQKGFWLPVDGAGYFSGRYLADHFRGPTMLTDYTVNKGNDNVAANPAHVAGSQIGLLRLTTGDAGTGTAADSSSWTAALNWTAEDGEITGIFRAALSAITNVAFFIGFTDALASTLEMPFTLSGTTFTSNASDAAGFLFDTAATTDTIRCVGVADGTDGTPLDSSLAPEAATHREYKLTISTAGLAKFWIDGTLIGEIASAVTPDVPLTPILIAEARSTASRTFDADYVLAK
jgi:hypothetical protein